MANDDDREIEAELQARRVTEIDRIRRELRMLPTPRTPAQWKRQHALAMRALDRILQGAAIACGGPTYPPTTWTALIANDVRSVFKLSDR